MPTIVCPKKITCEGSDSPLSNFSSEAPDLISFLGIGFPITYGDLPFGPVDEDPIRPAWWAVGCISPCISNVSQDAANACAAAQAFRCSGTPPPDVDLPLVEFFNTEKKCAFTCPDGSLFTWTVIAGSVVAGSQELADRIAEEIACARAFQRHLCLPPITSRACLGSEYSQDITISSGAPPFTFTISSGALPAGITMVQTSQTSVTISGTPTATGNSSFTLVVTDPDGNFMTKEYTIKVLGFLTATPLPNGTAGADYSETLTADGGTPPYTIDLVLGALPTGFVLSPTGVLSGNTSDTGAFAFTLSVVDSEGNFCTKDFTMTVAGLICPILDGNFAEAAINGLNAARDASIGRLIIWGTNRLVDADTHATIAPIAVDPNPGACYVPTTQKFCACTPTGGFNFINALNGNLNTVGGQTNNVSVPVYAPDEDTVYGIGQDGITFHWFISRVAAATELILTNTDIGLLPGSPGNPAYCASPKRLLTNGVSGPQTIDLLSLPGGAVLASRNLNAAGFGFFGNSILFHPGTGHFFVSCVSDDPGMTIQVLELDPVGLALIHTYSLEPVGIGNTFPIDYNPTNGEIYVGGTTQIFAIDPGSKTVICGVVVAWIPYSLGFDQFTQKLFLSNAGFGRVDHYH